MLLLVMLNSVSMVQFGGSSWRWRAIGNWSSLLRRRVVCHLPGEAGTLMAISAPACMFVGAFLWDKTAASVALLQGRRR